MPQKWWGKSLGELNVRAKWHATVIAVRSREREEMDMAPGGDHVFRQGETAVLLGRYEDIDRLNER